MRAWHIPVGKNSIKDKGLYCSESAHFFQFHQYNLKLYKLILPYAKIHNRPSK